jgi:hypothetical protein
MFGRDRAWAPASPVYAEHSFVTWSAPLRGEDADRAANGKTSATAAASTRYFFISLLLRGRG